MQIDSNKISIGRLFPDSNVVMVLSTLLTSINSKIHYAPTTGTKSCTILKRGVVQGTTRKRTIAQKLMHE